MDVVDTLPRAIAIIRKEVAKNAAFFLQKKIDTRNLNNVVAALTAEVDAGAFECRQTEVGGALAKPAIKRRSCWWVRTKATALINNVLDKGQTQFDDTRHSEESAAHNFAMLEESLADQLVQDNKALEKAEKVKAEFTTASEAEKANLAEAEKSFAALGCKQKQLRPSGFFRITRPP